MPHSPSGQRKPEPPGRHIGMGDLPFKMGGELIPLRRRVYRFSVCVNERGTGRLEPS